MKYLKPIVAAVCLAMLLTSLTLAADSLVPRRAIVHADSPEQLQEALDDLGGQVVASIPQSHSYLITVNKSASNVDPTVLLKGRGGIHYTHPEATYYLPETNQISIGFPDEDDPKLNAGTSPPLYYGQPGVYATGIDSAQALFDGSGVVVAVIDNGLDFSHPLFEDASFAQGYDFVDNDSIPAEEVGTLQSHGTFVTGLIRRTAPGATLMPIRVFNENGAGYEFAIVQGIYWAIDHGANVINMSFSTYAPSRTLETAISDALNAGITLLASVGNDSTYVPAYPAAYPGVVAVSAIDTLEYLAGFSSFGGHVDVCAPGVSVYSAFSGDHEWGTWSGTSFSVALVAGTAALTLQAHPELGPMDIESHLRSTSRTTLAWGNISAPSQYYGYGVINALASVLPNLAGDINESGSRDMVDLTLLLRLVTGRTSPTTKVAGTGDLQHVNPSAADLNSDGVVNNDDVSAMVGLMFEGSGTTGYKMARVR